MNIHWLQIKQFWVYYLRDAATWAQLVDYNFTPCAIRRYKPRRRRRMSFVNSISSGVRSCKNL